MSRHDPPESEQHMPSDHRTILRPHEPVTRPLLRPPAAETGTIPARPPRRFRRGRRVVGCLGLAAIATTAGTVPAVSAQSFAAPLSTGMQRLTAPTTLTETLPGVLLLGGPTNRLKTTLFAYTKPGDTVRAAFRRSTLPVDMWAPSTVTMISPSGVVTDTIMIDTSTPATTIVGGEHVSNEDGVWSIIVEDRPPTSAFSGANLTWEVGVHRNAAKIPGRVFTESLGARSTAPADITLYALTRTGGLYRQVLRAFDGVDSTLQVSNKGNTKLGDPQCAPVYRSVPMPSSSEADGIGRTYRQPLDPADCAGLERYRLFFETPSADLPASTSNWADKRATGTWLGPRYSAPQVTGLSFTRAAATSNAGVVEGLLPTQPGTVDVQIDADGDGRFDGPSDVRLTRTAPRTGAFSIEWDGRDGRGVDTSTATAVSMRATLSRTNEAHFLRIDAERSLGGIEIERLTGGTTAPRAVHFDDSLFDDSSSERFSRSTPTQTPLGGLDSLGGVHRWAADDSPADRNPNTNTGSTGSWGDMRSIDDWAFGGDTAVGELVVAPAALPSPSPSSTPAATPAPTPFPSPSPAPAALPPSAPTPETPLRTPSSTPAGDATPARGSVPPLRAANTSLARTGAESTAIGIGAAGAIVLGAAAYLLRRRNRRSTAPSETSEENGS